MVLISLPAEGNTLLMEGQVPEWCSGGVKWIRSKSSNIKGSQHRKMCSFGEKNILENAMDKVWWKVGIQGGGGEGKEEEGLEAPFVAQTGEGKRSYHFLLLEERTTNLCPVMSVRKLWYLIRLSDIPCSQPKPEQDAQAPAHAYRGAPETQKYGQSSHRNP